MDHKNPRSARVGTGMIFIAVGLLLLLKTMDVIDFNFPHIIFSFPFIMLVIGILVLVNSSNKILGGILAVLGGILLVPRVFPWIDYGGEVVFPVLIMALGAYILLRHRSGKIRNDRADSAESKAYSNDRIDDVAIFGGGHKMISSNNFQGGNITAIFGGSEIDLLNCKLAEGDNFLEVACIFGGTTIIVPKDWDVILNITPIFGGFSNKVIRNPNMPVDTSRKLIVKGVAIFGGGEIKYY